jgi:phage FluMu gp28-like protein
MNGPHAAQATIMQDTTRFRVVSAGRRFGKSKLGVAECLKVAAEEGGRAWWLAPIYKMTNVGWRPLTQMARKIPGSIVSLSERTITFPGGGEVAVRSADNPNSLRGEGLDFVIIDEAAFVDPDVWPSAIRPALSDRQGRALFISTPKGRNWFWEIYRRGVAHEDGWAAFTFPTSSNPYIPQAEIEAAKADLPDIIYRQEYLAEFVDMEGAVFRRIQEAATLEAIDGPEEGRQYIAAVDPAASVDYTVVTIWDVAAKTCVHMDRFNRVDYTVLGDRLHAVYNLFSCQTITIEVNGIGQGVVDHLQSRGMNIIPFTTTSATKQGVITKLQSAFEHGEIRIVNNAVMIGELLSFEAKRSPSGSYQYSAPDGMHDDCVMSLAIGWDCLSAPAMFVSGRY